MFVVVYYLNWLIGERVADLDFADDIAMILLDCTMIDCTMIVLRDVNK